MSYFLGIDGGGTKTLAVICDERGHEVARARSGGTNHQVGKEQAERNLNQVVEDVLDAARLTKPDITGTVYGLAGADREFDFDILRPMVKTIGLRPFDVVCDTIIALRAGTDKPYGVASLCGTGTNTVGVNKEGKTLQIGGFGYAYGDMGGGGELGVEVFRSVIRAWEGRAPETLLTEPVLEFMGFSSVEQMYHRGLDGNIQPPSGLARLLFDVADRDVVAQEILKKQGIELGITASACIRRLELQMEAFDIVLAGSIVTRGDRDGRFVRNHMERIVKPVAPNCTLRPLMVEPVVGALLLSMELTGQKVDEKTHRTLEQTLMID